MAKVWLCVTVALICNKLLLPYPGTSGVDWGGEQSSRRGKAVGLGGSLRLSSVTLSELLNIPEPQSPPRVVVRLP